MDKWQTMLALDRFNNCIVVLHVIMECMLLHLGLTSSKLCLH